MGDREGLLFQLFWQRLQSCRSGACEIRLQPLGNSKFSRIRFLKWVVFVVD
jgi:hypothetical protein